MEEEPPAVAEVPEPEEDDERRRSCGAVWGAAAAVEGITWAVGMEVRLRTGWKGGLLLLLLLLQKSSVLSDTEVPSPVSPLSAVPGRRPKRLWNFSDTAGVCHSMSAKRAADLDSKYLCDVVIP